MSDFPSPPLHNAYVPAAKCRDYLLNIHSRDGSTKARFFMRFGFTVDAWEILRTALLEQLRYGKLIRIKVNEHGHFYNYYGELPSPDKRNPEITTVWLLRSNTDTLQFITALPEQRSIV